MRTLLNDGNARLAKSYDNITDLRFTLCGHIENELSSYR